MATIQEIIAADLVTVEAQLVKANTALQEILDLQLEMYDLENMDTRQRGQQIKIDKLTKTIDWLTRKRDKLHGQLYGTRRCGSMRTRR